MKRSLSLSAIEEKAVAERPRSACQIPRVSLTRMIFYSLMIMMMLLSQPTRAQHERGEQASAEQKLRDMYGESIALRTKTIALTDTIRFTVVHLAGVPYNAKNVKVQCATVDGKRLYAIVDNVSGKEQPITYMVVFDDAEQIKAVEILAYREAYGGEVGYKSFRKQFEGKQYDGNLRIGGEIKNITGATISANAVTAGVRKIAALFHVIKEQLQ